MINDQITALAREYAEEATKDIPLDNDIKSLRESAIKLNAEGMEKRLRWLLRRFCLVEKSKVKDIRKGILVQFDPKNFGYSPYNQGRIDLLKSLFPEIAKEVEVNNTNNKNHENSWCENEL